MSRGISRRHSEAAPGQPEPGERSSPPQRQGGGAGSSLTRVTANFTPRATAALESIAARTGDSKTDILNRSVLAYEAFLELSRQCGGTVRVVHPDGSRERLWLLG